MTIKKYAFINSVNNTVFTTMIFDLEENPNLSNIIEGMSSNPKIIEVSPNSKVDRGWILENEILKQGDSNV